MHSHDHSHLSTKRLRAAFFLNFFFAIFEIIGGLYTNSAAILSDALHDLGDSIALGTAWILEKKSFQKQDDKYSFGYRRFSLLGALINALVLIIGSLFILGHSIPKLMNPAPTNALGMLIFAIIGMAVNGLAVFKLRGGNSLNEQMVSWHLLEDILGWFAVLVLSVFLLFFDWYILDPILSILILVYVSYNVLKNLRQTLHIFLQGVPVVMNMAQIRKELLTIEHVTGIHHTHLWSLDGERNVFSVHLVLDGTVDVNELIKIKRTCRNKLMKFPIDHCTIEIELSDEDCSMEQG